jgi:hypothetical protein
MVQPAHISATTQTSTTPALRVLKCSNCGAGLPVALGRQSVRCVFCGAECSTPQLDGAVKLTARMASAEGEGLDALHAAHLCRLEPTRTQQVVAAMAWTIVPATATGVGGLVLFTEGIVGESTFPILSYAALGFGGVGWYISKRWLCWLATRRAKQLTLGAHQAMSSAALPSRCPSCGGNVQVPDRAAALTCPFCCVPLLASDGMLVRWVEDAEERRLEWLVRANELLDRTRLREIRAARRAPVVISIAAIGIALAAGGTASMLISSLRLTQVDIVCRGVCSVDGMTCLKGGEIAIYLAPGETKDIRLWEAPGKWKSQRVSVPKGERLVFVCPPTPDAPRTVFYDTRD